MTEILQQAGYFIGKTRKAWGPGQLAPGGRSVDPAGPNYQSFAEFVKAAPQDKPFCFWFGSTDPHRPYEWQSGAKSGFDPAKVKVPAALPNNDLTRNDVADYLVSRGMPFRQAHEVVGAMVRQLVADGRDIEALTVSEWQAFSPLFAEDVKSRVTALASVQARRTPQSTNPAAVAARLDQIRAWLETP